MPNTFGPSPPPVFRAFDTTGKPLAGGTLQSYQAGTTTPLATYTSAAGTTPNANPVVLDSTGQAPVFLSNLPYKLVLKDSSGVTQWTEDNVIAPCFVSAAMGPVVAAATVAAALTALGGVTSTTVASMIAAAINNYVNDTGTADAYVVALNPAITSYTNGLTIKVKLGTGNTNTTTTPTLNAGGGAKVIVNNAAGALAAGDLVGPSVITVTYDSTLTKWVLSELVFSQLQKPANPKPGPYKFSMNWASNTTATLASGSAVVSNGTTSIAVPNFSGTLNMASSGANGLDTGSRTTNSWYYTHLIWNPTTSTQACLASLSSTAPTLPSGYTYSCLAGVIRTDGSSNLLGFTQVGPRWRYQVGNNLSVLPVITSGSMNWTAASITGFVPTVISGYISVTLAQTGNSAVGIAPNGNYGASGAPTVANPSPLSSSDPSSSNEVTVEMNLESSSVYYYSNSGSNSASCYGFDLNL